MNKLEGVTGADNFEKLTLGDGTVTTTVTDEPGTGTPGTGNEGDKVSVTIVSNGNVTEDQQPSFTVKVNQPLDRPLTVTLSNGDKVTIAAGQTQVEYKAPAQGDDVFTIPGTRRIERLEENLGAWKVTFTAEELADIRRRLPRETAGARY